MSTTARLAPLSAPYDDTVQRNFDRLAALGSEPLKLFRTVAHNPRVLDRLFAGSLLDRGALNLRQRELVILRTCARSGCEYEWGVHVALFAKRAGLSQEEICTLGPHIEAGAWSEAESALLAAADALHESATLPDAQWQALQAHYSPAQIVEILALAGYYRTIAYLANALRVEPEAYGAAFPA
ncbi:MAG TPA: carboxymuconolactone decarboxylase family protein [Burkholderiaceae bacterium]